MEFYYKLLKNNWKKLKYTENILKFYKFLK